MIREDIRLGVRDAAAAGDMTGKVVRKQPVVVTNLNGKFDSALFTFGSGSRIVFVSAPIAGSALGGVAGADAHCSSEAASRSLPGTFKAWIGDATTDPATTFPQNLGPYVRSPTAK